MLSLIDIHELHHTLRPTIEERLHGFRDQWESASEEELFREVVFCLLTPQSKGRACWDAACALDDKGLLLTGAAEDVAAALASTGVRFHHTKARRVVAARLLFAPEGRLSVRTVLGRFKDPKDAREWLVEHVKGLGYKESGHLLRNLGMGAHLAILDRHILRCLKELEVIAEIPKTLTPRRYLSIERKMAAFAEREGIPLDHMDLVFWARATGEVFK